jgi:nucleoside-diphosphate-sugar epimerase
MRQRVLITGASGFIGKRLAGALAQGGWAVRAAMRDPSAVALAGVETVVLPDLSRPVEWGPLLEGVTHIVHLAGLAHSPGVLADAVYDRINANAAGELAQAATGIERLVLMSSVRAQAGLSADRTITEEDEPEPTDAYGRSKLAAERLVAASGTRFSILRPVVVYGPGVKGNIANLATLARTPMPLPFGALDNRRSLLAIDNLISAINLALVSERALGETLLVADRNPITVADLVTAMRDGLGRAPQLMKVPAGAVRRIMASFGKEADWERISGNFVVDTAKLRGIGWEPAVPTYAGIKAMMQDT